MSLLPRRSWYLAIAALPAVAFASGEGAVAGVALNLAIILVAAKLGGEAATRIGQPAVLGELVVGVVLGNLNLVGVHVFEGMKSDVFLDLLAQLGVLLLLFEVGLESTVRQMLSLGPSSLLVAILGVVAPFGLGWLASSLLLPNASPYVHAFIGATLCATSVGITARVLGDTGKSKTPEARVILGAAVIDDVLGLVILAVVTGLIQAADRGATLSFGAIALVVAKAVAFLVGGLALGIVLSPRLFREAARVRTPGVLLALGLAFCFVLAWAAGEMGLAPIVGAFAAGLVLEDLHYKDFTKRGEHGLEELVKPISAFLVPIFFVLMGMHTDLSAFASPQILALAAVLIVVAIIGKQASSLGVVQPGIDRLSVGLGMVPRGEVGLIFAAMGHSLTLGGEPVIDDATFGAVVLMVIVTTMVTPQALKWSLSRGDEATPPN